MYWNNTWLNNYNSGVFFSKTLFLENILFFIFSEKIFQNFFEKKSEVLPKEVLSKEIFFKKFFLKKFKSKKIFRDKRFFFFTKKFKNKKKQSKITKYNFTRFWFVKLNKFLLISSFVFFYLKVRTVKKNSPKRKNILNKTVLVFWKKRKGDNLKKKKFKTFKLLVF